ncbi:MAG: metallophosphoesterase family protein [Terriglobia bacterium]
MKIGIVSDTHGYFDSRLTSLLAGVDRILHAGDVGSRPVLDELESIAPAHAVRGNVDPPELGLPPRRVMALDGLQVEMLHILPAPQTQVEAWTMVNYSADKAGAGSRERFLRNFDPATRVVIFGHTHQPALFEIKRTLFVNPGSAGKKRFSLPRCCALMQISGREGEIKLLSLEGYNEKVIGSIRFKWECRRHA